MTGGKDGHRVLPPWCRWTLLSMLACLSACATGSQWRPEEPGASLVTIRGLLSVPERGRFELLDCRSKAPFTLGGMSAGNAHYLQRRFGEISRRSPGPVTAEFAGHVRKSGKGYRIERPALVYVAPGQCVEQEEGGLDY